MFGEGNSLPIGGSILLAAAAYAAISAFVTGPLVAERTIERSGWQAQCSADLKDHLAAEGSASAPAAHVPNMDCNALMGLFGTDGRQLCRGLESFGLPGLDQIQAQQRRMQEARRRRLETAISNVASRCSCAASLMMETRRIPFAIYSGSARLITPAPVKNLSNELEASLRSPLCAGKE